MTVKELIEKMSEGIVEFEFKKKDGSVRVAHGTLVSGLIDYEFKGSTAAQSDEVCVYWDTDKAAWRSFRKENLL